MPSSKFSYNISVIKDLGASIFQVDLGWTSKTSVEFYILGIIPITELRSDQEDP